jgi:hypothetical protein
VFESAQPTPESTQPPNDGQYWQSFCFHRIRKTLKLFLFFCSPVFATHDAHDESDEQSCASATDKATMKKITIGKIILSPKIHNIGHTTKAQDFHNVRHTTRRKRSDASKPFFVATDEEQDEQKPQTTKKIT